MLEIRKFLTVSTSHVSEETAGMLDENVSDDWPVIGAPYSNVGWFIYSNLSHTRMHISEELRLVLAFAEENDCTYVLFDRDGPVVASLPVFDW